MTTTRAFSGRAAHLDAGFTLVESLVALVLGLAVSSAVFNLVNPQATMARAQPEQMDMQQRARVASDALLGELQMAGAGLDAGPRAGSLRRFLPPVVPRRLGLETPDAFDAVRPDVVTVAYVPFSSAQTTTVATIAGASPVLEVTAYADCPAPRVLCGIATGSTVLVFDRGGRFSFFRVTGDRGAAADLRALEPGASPSYPAGAFVAEAGLHTFYLDRAARELRHYDGDRTDTPVVDHVVDLQFEYFGDPNPPARPKPAIGQPNCLYDAGGNATGGLAVLASNGASLVPLPLGMFGDGPWCGEGANRFDADLLRIRKIRVKLRVEAGPDWARGTTADVLVAGTSRSALSSVSDYAVAFDVTPRNLSIGR